MNVPKEVQGALTSAGGKNIFGEPNYRFAWSGNETRKISNGSGYEEFRVCADDAWLLMKWDGPDFWGTEDEWNQVNYDPSGFLIAGPYPRQGRYRMVRKLVRPVVNGDEMTFEPLAPTLQFVREVFPGLRDFLELETEQKAQILRDKEAEESEAFRKMISDSRMNYRGVATARQIADKVAAIERFHRDPVKMANAQRLMQGRKRVN